MKFKYKSYESGILRPVIPIEIHHHDLEISYEVLIDSGADICIFNSGLTDILGVNLVKGIKKQIIGATGFPQDLYIHPISIVVGSIKFKLDVGFMDISYNSYGIVGQMGFFDKFIVKFDLKKEEIEVKSHL